MHRPKISTGTCIVTHTLFFKIGLPIVQFRLWLGDFPGCLASGEVKKFSFGVFKRNGIGRPDSVGSLLCIYHIHKRGKEGYLSNLPSVSYTGEIIKKQGKNPWKFSTRMC